MLPLGYVLEQQWLTAPEARIYLCALELWVAPASQIARKLDENRVSVYSTLQLLVKKGIIVEITKNKVKQYIPLSPDKLLERSQSKTDMLGGVMSDLLALTANDQGRPSVQVYEWIEWIKMCYEDTLQYPDSELKAFLGYGKVEKTLQRWLNYEYLPRRLKHRIHARVIIPADLKKNTYDYATNIDQKAYDTMTTIKYIEDADFSLTNEINLYWEDKVLMVMFNQNEMMGLVIKSKMLFDTLSSLFNLTRKKW